MSNSVHLVVISALLLANDGYASSATTQKAAAIPTPGWSIAFIDTVDQISSSQYSQTSIAVDADNAAHVSYRGPGHDLRYASNDNGCWLTQTVYDPTLSVARDNSIAADSNNRPHISFSYSDGADEDLMYAANLTGTWQIAAVDTALSTGMENDIAIDNNGNDHISHRQWNRSELRHSANITGTWITEVITNAIWSKTSIGTDANNKTHIAFTSSGSLKYASNVSGKWEITTIDGVGRHPSISIDADNNAHISYSNVGGLKYATNTSGLWASVVITSVAVDRYHAIAVDSANRAHISFYDPADGSLKYANNVAGMWSIYTIDNAGDVGRSSSIAVDSNDLVHISYRDDNVQAPMLKYATNGTTPPCHLAYLPTVQRQPSWNLIWGDEFNGSGGINMSDWIYATGTAYPGGPPNWGTGEVESMSSSIDNVFQSGGYLNIRALHTGTTPTSGWTSGRIETVRTDFQPQTDGLMAVEASIQLPNITGPAAQGYWPAFWMLGAPYRGNHWNWPSVGEIDIMENVNGVNAWWGVFHCGINPGGPCNEPAGLSGSASGFSPSLQDGFHRYRIEFDKSVSPQQLRWYVDGVQRHIVYSNQIDAPNWNSATNHGFFVILNVAIGGSWPGNPISSTVSGGTMRIDYVRVYTATSP